MEGRIDSHPQIYTHVGSEKWNLQPWTDEPALLTLVEHADKTNIIQEKKLRLVKLCPKNIKQVTEPKSIIKNQDTQLPYVPPIHDLSSYRTRHFQSVHNNVGGVSRSSIDPSKQKIYQAIERIQRQKQYLGIVTTKNSSKVNSTHLSKKNSDVENRYAKWKKKIEQLAKNKDDGRNSPRLPKIELCWL